MFVTLNPILELLNYDFNLENLFNVEYEQTYSSIDSEMKDIYITGIEETIKEEIINLGYKVKYLIKYSMSLSSKYISTLPFDKEILFM